MKPGGWIGWCWLMAAVSSEAATICRVASTGQIAETYSSTQPEGLCVRNLTSSGIPAQDIEQLTVDEPVRRQQLARWEAHANNPDVEKRRQRAERIAQSMATLQTKLGLTAQEFQELRDALR